MKFIYLIYTFLFLLIIINSCSRDEKITLQQPVDYKINLRWDQAYTNETKEYVETGLLWTFTFLGAEIPGGSFHQSLVWNNNIVQLNLSEIGFNPIALNAFAKLLPQLKESEEYKKFNAMDIGRFIMLTLNSSYHYYAITGASPSYTQVRAGKIFDPVKAAITQSNVTSTNRIIEVPDSAFRRFSNMTFIAEECDGSIQLGTQQAYEREITELMSNGQFRFAIYDINNRLLSASNITKTQSGKPAKCLWCHEINLQPTFNNQTMVAGYYHADAFNNLIYSNKLFLTAYRNTLNSDIDFTKKQDHTYAELLYISFMEPSAERLSIEWNMSVNDVKNKLISLTTHSNTEFPYLGILYDRKDVDLFSPYQYIRVPQSAREFSEYEPDLIH